MSNSSLVNLNVPAYTGNYTKGRSGKTISEITIHHMAAKWTAKRCGEAFQAVGREGSSHYGIGYDGEIAQYVDEADTAWTNSNWDANCRAVTIETANSVMSGDWPVSDVTLKSLINLVADIAKRNGLIPLVKGLNLTWHQMYAATSCPGPYLLSKIDYIVEEANKIITSGGNVVITTTPVDITYQVYTNKWLCNVSQHNKNDDMNGYAGVFGNPVSGVYIDSSVGNVYYQVHVKGGNWLPEVKNREDYAGIFGQPIDAIMIKSDSTTIHYEVHTKEDGWLGEVSGYDKNDHNYGYAGWQGHAIDAIVVWADPIVTTTIIEVPKEEPEATPQPETQVVEQLYRIRTSWDDAKSQVGAYKNLDSAIKVCQEKSESAGVIYSVFDNDGNVKYTGTIKVAEPDVSEPNTDEVVPVFNLDYPNKVLIVDKSVSRTNEECVKAINAIKANNPEFDENIAKAFFTLAPIYGIDPIMAISQSVLETGWFKYQGSAVKSEHHNYCGLGVTSNGITGGIFDTIEDGVTAQYQHLFAYGTKDALPEGQEILDPRFKYVTRGIAPYWQQLAGRWACPGYDKSKYDTPQKAMEAGNTYGQKIITLFNSIIATSVSDADVEKYFGKDESEEDKIIDVPAEEVKQEETASPTTDEIVDDVVVEQGEPVEKKNGLIDLISMLINSIVKIFKAIFKS